MKKVKSAFSKKRINAVVTAFFLMLFSLGVQAQSVWDKFEQHEEVNTVLVNKRMFDLMSKVKTDPNDKNQQQYLNLLKKLDHLRVYSSNHPRYSSELKTTAGTYLKSSGLDELMSLNENGQKVRISIKPGSGESIKELFMLVEDNAPNKETVVMSLKGNFELQDLSLLTDRMNLPASESIKKASKKKN